MSATTPVYGWPYQTRTDAPDGALLGANLALAVEATLRGVDLRTAALEASSSFMLAKPAAQIYSTVVQSIPNITYTALTFNTERFDSDPAGTGGHSTSVNTSRYTAVYAGWYLVQARYTYAANATGFRAAVLSVNGFQMPETLVFGGTPTASLTQHVATQALVPLNPGDYVEVLAFQSSGGALNTDTANSAFPSMTVVWERNP